MRHIGADIREIGLPVEKVTAGLKDTLSALGWWVIDERCHDGCLTIRAAGNLSGGLAFRVASGRQRAEWWLRPSSEGRTRMETRYGLDPRFRRRFWSVLVLLASLSLFFYYASEPIFTAISVQSPTKIALSFWFYILSLCLSASFLLAGFAFAISAIAGNQKFSIIIKAIGTNLERKHGKYPQKVYQSDYLFPDIFYLLAFSLSGLILFLSFECKFRGNCHLVHLPGFWSIFCLMGVLLGLLLPCLLYRGFKERITFIILAIAVIIPVAIVYGLPTFNFWLPDRMSAMSPMTANGFPAVSIHRLVWTYPEHVKALAFLLAAGNLAFLLLAVILAAIIPRLTEQLVRQRTTFFLNAPRQSVYRQALEANTFLRSFVVYVLALWLVIAGILFWVLYTGLSVFELGLWGRQVWFASRAGMVFFDTLHLIASVIALPLHAGNFAIPVARFMALVYGMPLVGAIFLVAAKRWTAWRRKQRLLRSRSSVRTETNMQGILSQCNQICHENGVSRTLLIVDSSPLPMLQCFFTGFPHFRYALVVSRGCQRLTANEIEGLLAHEIFHIRRHTFRWYFLNLLSDITFFGTGFLAAMINSYENELEADRFALEWIRKRHIPAADYIQALRIVSMAASATPGGSSLMALTPIDSSRRRPKGKLRLLFDLYFGETVANYIHPPLEARIAIIEAIAAGEPFVGGPDPPVG